MFVGGRSRSTKKIELSLWPCWLDKPVTPFSAIAEDSCYCSWGKKKNPKVWVCSFKVKEIANILWTRYVVSVRKVLSMDPGPRNTAIHGELWQGDGCIFESLVHFRKVLFVCTLSLKDNNNITVCWSCGNQPSLNMNMKSGSIMSPSLDWCNSVKCSSGSFVFSFHFYSVRHKLIHVKCEVLWGAKPLVG